MQKCTLGIVTMALLLASCGSNSTGPSAGSNENSLHIWGTYAGNTIDSEFTVQMQTRVEQDSTPYGDPYVWIGVIGPDYDTYGTHPPDWDWDFLLEIEMLGEIAEGDRSADLSNDIVVTVLGNDLVDLRLDQDSTGVEFVIDAVDPEKMRFSGYFTLPVYEYRIR